MITDEESNRQLGLGMNKEDSTNSNNMNIIEQYSKSLVGHEESSSKDLKIPWNTNTMNDDQCEVTNKYDGSGADDIQYGETQMVLLNAAEKSIVHEDLNDHSEVKSKLMVNAKDDKDDSFKDNQMLVSYGAQLSIARGRAGEKEVQN